MDANAKRLSRVIEMNIEANVGWNLEHIVSYNGKCGSAKNLNYFAIHAGEGKE